MLAVFGFFGLGPQELIPILLLLIILFGAKKLPELARGLGQGIKEFKKATKEINEEDVKEIEESKEKE